MSQRKHLDTEQLGLLRALGIEKGKAFNPDERMKKILDTARQNRFGHGPGDRLSVT